jgi:hypothetical protein
MKKVFFTILFMLGLLGLALANIGSALTVPLTIEVSGRIISDSPLPPPGGADFSVYIYDAKEDPSSLIASYDVPSSPPVINNTTGIFCLPVILPNDIFLNDSDLWLEIHYGTNVFAPRQQLLSVPFAITTRNIRSNGSVIVSNAQSVPISGTFLGLAPALSGVVGNSTSALTTAVSGRAPQGYGVSGSGYYAGIFGETVGEVSYASGVLGLQTDSSTRSPILGTILLGADLIPVGGVAGSAAGGFPGISGLSNTGFGVYGISLAPLGIGVCGSTDAYTGKGVWGNASNGGIGVFGTSANNTGIYGESDRIGILGSSASDIPISGWSRSGWGIVGYSQTGVAVQGESNHGNGVVGFSHDPHHFSIYGVSRVGPDDISTPAEGAGITGRSYNVNGGPAVQGLSQSEVAAGVFGRGSHSNGVLGESSGPGKAGVCGIGTTRPGHAMGGWFVGDSSGSGAAIKIDGGIKMDTVGTVDLTSDPFIFVITGTIEVLRTSRAAWERAGSPTISAFRTDGEHDWTAISTVEINAPLGTIIFSAPTMSRTTPVGDFTWHNYISSYISVNNSYVSPNSLIFLKPGGGIGGYDAISVLKKGDGNFCVGIYGNYVSSFFGSSRISNIDFLVVN